MTQKEKRTLNKEKILDLRSTEWNLLGLFNLVEMWGTMLNISKLKEIKVNLWTKIKTFNEFLDEFDRLFKGKINYTFINDPREKKND